jgi:CheY-like chemotaxis protein
MDVQMPVMDGLTATRKLREKLKLRLPVLAMTAGVLPSERAKCVEAGMDDLIGKPLDVDSMLATIARHCGVVSDDHRAPVLQEPSVFAPEVMLAATGNNPATRAAVVSVCKELVAKAMAPLDDVRRHLQQGDSAAAGRILHGLRGSLGSVGAKLFAASALSLEQAIRVGDTSRIEELVRDAQDALQAVIAAAQQWLEEQAPVPAAEVATALAAADPQSLARFVHTLEQQDMDALMEFATLQPSLDVMLNPQAAAALAEAMSNLNFDEALSILKAQGVGLDV